MPIDRFFAWQTAAGADATDVDPVPAEATSATPARPTPAPADSTAAKLCPACGRFMTRFRVADDLGFGVDRCGGCAGVWLDAGEWEQLKVRGLHRRLNFSFSESWQQRLQEEERERLNEARYRRLLGDAVYGRAVEIREWLAGQPQRHVIMALFQAGRED